jgi:cytochrome c oxidase assembly protein subunit 15
MTYTATSFSLRRRPLTARGRDRAVGVWLLSVGLMIFATVILGGITRLSGSGLSIMEWKPLMGTLPPTSTAEWNRIFGLYQQIAQYKHINAGMTLPGFQNIFWWEYSHRLWDRIIGLVFLVPFLWFLFRGYLRRGSGSRVGAPRLAAIFALGALEGFLGWYMVSSGFEDRDSVSQYRLILHLIMAVFIYALILWSAFDLLQPDRIAGHRGRIRGAANNTRLLVVLIFCEMALGGLVAGLHGGLVYNDFPFMNGAWIAPDLWSMSPWWVNITENPGCAQFLHRIGAGLVTLTVIALAIRATSPDLAGVLRARILLVGLGLVIQVTLGILTLRLLVPLPLAVAHQGGALLLLSLTLFLMHGFKRAAAGYNGIT